MTTTAVEAVRQCPSCSAHTHTPVLGRGNDGLDLVRCDRCGLVHALGRHRAPLLDAGYGVRAHGHDHVDRARKQRSVELYDRLTGGRIAAPPTGATALDLGCNTGLLLDVLAALGWHTEGVERSPGAREYAARHHRIHDVDLEDPQASTGRRYQLVTMTHVLEHMCKPIEVARFVGRHLDDGGIGVIEVPNWDDVARGLWGKHYRPLELGDHVCFFDRESLGHVLTAGGLAIDAMWSRPQGATLVMPSLLTALDRARALAPWWRHSTHGALSARGDQGQRAPGGLRGAMLHALDQLDPWLDRVAGADSRAGANLVAIVHRG